MTPEEKFLFDLNGYLVIKNVLTPQELSELNSIADEKCAGNSTFRTGRVSHWGPPYQALIDHPTVLPYLLTLIDSKFRLDHDYCIFMSQGDPSQNLHGGEGHEGDHWYRYRDGQMLNGLCVVTFFLAPAGPGDGGFVCVPGTHKSHFVNAIPRDIMRQERDAPYVVQPIVEAGDALFFTEALVHGTRGWTATHQRRALLYKYSPGYSAWSNKYYSLDEFESLTDQQKRILAPPSVGSRPEVVQTA